MVFANSPNAIVPFGSKWRLGANEATEIEFFTNVSIDGKNLPKGRYIMYAIPYPDHWTIVFNNNLYSWGLQIDTTKDVLRTDIPASKQQPIVPDFTMTFKNSTSGADLIMAWDTVKAMLPITFKK